MMITQQMLLGYGGSAPIISLSFINNTTSTTANFTYPGSIVAGDLLIAWDWSIYSPGNVVPSGFTQLFSQAIVDGRLTVSYKIATGSEAGSVAGLNGYFNSKYMLQFRGDSPLSLAAAFDFTYQSTSGNPTAQIVNVAGQSTPLIVIGNYEGTGAVDPRNFSPAADGEFSISTSSYLKYKIYNSSPSDTTIDMDDEGFNDLSSGAILVS